MANRGGVLVVAETIDGALAPISAELIGAGTKLAEALGTTVTAALLGNNLGAASASLAELGAARVLVADDERLADLSTDPTVTVLAAIVRAEEPAAVLFGHTPNLREAAIRLAYRLGTSITADATALRAEDGQVVITKPVYGGAAIAEYMTEAGPAIATLRPRAFPAAEPSGQSATVEPVELPADLS
jgi:electron transfer flavoprotein alpha subunit